jgi:hypothetical protein
MFNPFFYKGAKFGPLDNRIKMMGINIDETYLKSSQGHVFGPQKD